MTNVSAVEKMAELMQQMEESSPRVAALQYCLKQVAEKVEEAEKRNAELEARCAALAAENAGLKAANAEGCKWDGEQWVGISIETPATDAFLAEVRAQGVERLAKVWYAIANETDPGISISESSRLKYRQRADDAAEFANDIRHEAAQLRKGVQS